MRRRTHSDSHRRVSRSAGPRGCTAAPLSRWLRRRPRTTTPGAAPSSPPPARHQRDRRLALGQALGLEDLEQRLRDLGVLRDLRERLAHDLRPHRRGLGELDGRLALGGAGDDAHLVRAVLLDRRGHLAQAVDHLLLDLRGSCPRRGSAPCGCRPSRACSPTRCDFGETSSRTVWLMAWRFSSMSASCMLRQAAHRGVARRWRASEPRGSAFLNR